jgi:hypothetical protein
MSDNGWVKPGAAAVLFRSQRGMGTASMVPVTVERVGKRDVVLSNGTRMNVNRLQIDNGTWESPTRLLQPDDPRLQQARKDNRKHNAQHRVRSAITEWERNPTDAATVALVSALHRWLPHAEHDVGEVGDHG